MAVKRIAAIDIGSNAPRLMIAELRDNSLPKVIDSVRATLSLGVDTYNNNHISEASINELCEILENFKLKLKEYNIKDYRVVATSAVREADNRDFVLARIKQKTKFECEILSNSEERYLHNLALSETFPMFEDLSIEGMVVVDMGAGSVQISSYKDGNRNMSQNLKLGYLRMSELFSEIKTRSSNYDQMMNDYISSQLHSLGIFGLNSNDDVSMIANGNDLEFIRNLDSLIDLDGDYVSKEQLLELYSILQRTRPLELTLHHSIPSDVAGNILTIVMILLRFLDALSLEGLYIPRMQLSFGVILYRAIEEKQYESKHSHYNDLISAVDVMVRQYGGYIEHLDAKEKDALAIYKVLAKKHDFAEDAELKLRLTAKLSEVGKFIVPDEYEETSAEVVLANEFIGISDHSTEIIANSIRYSAGIETPMSDELNYRSSNFRQQVIQGAAILRVVDSLEYSAKNKIKSIKTKLRKGVLTLEVETNEDLSLERWMLQQKAVLLEEFFGVKLVLKEV